MTYEAIIKILRELADEMKTDIMLSSHSNCKIPANYVRDYVDDIESLMRLIKPKKTCSDCPFMTENGCRLDQNVFECKYNEN